MDGKDLLVEALGQIEMHPETWRQGSWWCGTAGCLAGWMSKLDETVVGASMTFHQMTGQYLIHGVVTETGRVLDYESYVARRLNIGLYEAAALTDAGNDLVSLRVGVKAVLNGENVADAILEEKVERRNGN